MDGMLYRVDGKEYIPIGEMREIPTITLPADDDLPDIKLTWDEEFTLDFTIDWLEGYSKKKVRMYRKAFGIDLVPLRFPRKKNRRKKRLYRRARKLIMEIGRIK